MLQKLVLNLSKFLTVSSVLALLPLAAYAQSENPPGPPPLDQQSEARFTKHTSFDPIATYRNYYDEHSTRQRSLYSPVLYGEESAQGELLLGSGKTLPLYRLKFTFKKDGSTQVFTITPWRSWEKVFEGDIQQLWWPAEGYVGSGQSPDNLKILKTGYRAAIFADQDKIYFYLGESSDTRLYSIKRPYYDKIEDINFEETLTGDGELSIKTARGSATYFVRKIDGRAILKNRDFHHGPNPKIEEELSSAFKADGTEFSGDGTKPAEIEAETFVTQFPVLKRITQRDRMALLYLDGSFEIIDLKTKEVLMVNHSAGFSARDISLAGTHLVVETKAGQRAVYSLASGQYKFLQTPNTALRSHFSAHLLKQIRCENVAE